MQKATDMPTIVVFDLDGTLTYRGAMTRAVDRLHAEALVVKAFLAFDRVYKPAQAFKRAVLPQDLGLGSLKAAILSAVASPRRNLKPLINTLETQGIKPGLLSNNSRPAWGERLERHLDFSGLIENGFFQEDVPDVKPSPLGLNEVIKQLSRPFRRETFWYVGDSQSDMIAAELAQAQTYHKVIPVALGANSSAARYLESKFQAAGEYMAFNSLKDMNAHLLSVPANDDALKLAS